MLKKQAHGYYALVKCADAQLATLFTFLRFGPYKDEYVEFLIDKTRKEFYGNLVNLAKTDAKVVIQIDEYQFPGLPICTISIDNLLTILQEWKLLEKVEPETIILTRENDIMVLKIEA